MLRRRLLIEWCAIAIVTIALVTAMVLTHMPARLDNSAYDLFIGLRAPPPSDRILIVAIDDASIAAIGPWPWPRSVHARALERIAAAKPSAVAYDVLFTEPGSQDGQLAQALQQVPTVLPILFEAPGLNGRAIDVVPPVAPIRRAAAAIGHVALPQDEDGTARAALLTVDADGQRWAHAMEATYRLVFGVHSAAYLRASRTGPAWLGVPYQPYAGGFRTVPFESVLAGRVPAAFLRDHIVLVGATAGGLGDRHKVPTRGGAAIAGVEVQANLLNALIADRLVREAPLSLRLAAALLPNILLLLGFWWLRPSRALIVSIAMIVLMVGLPLGLLVFAGFWIPPMAGLIGLLLVYPLWGWRRLQTVDGAIGRELALFATDGPGGAAKAWPDSADGHAAQLSNSIAQLRNIRRLIADTIEGVADPLIVTTNDDQILLANTAALGLHGAVRAGDPLPAEIMAADGRIFSPRRTPLRGGDGVQRGWILLLAEITAIRRAEQDREQALEFLSHDMRAPQASILTLIEGSGDGSMPSGAAERIAGHARRTLALADDFVQLARLRHAQFEPEETDLCDPLAEAMDAVWSQASHRGVRVEAMGLDEPHCVMGERHALTRMFVNLLDNAVKFSAAGGIVRCVLTRSPGDDGVEVVVEDEGSGIAPERAADLFARFGPITRQENSPACGLGLAYVFEVVARHNATIQHHPVVPHGARFHLCFPAAGEGESSI